MTAPRLLGHPVSNYVNIVRAALIEKGVAHEFVLSGAGRDEAFLARNPMGKIPVLDTGEGHVAETVAILEYLDDAYPDPSLRPADILARARGRQIVNIVQLYVEAPARSLYPGVFMGGANSDEAIAAARGTIDRGTAALGRLLAPEPFLLGEAISQADLFLFYNLELVDRLTRFVFGRSVRAEIGGLEAWDAVMRARPSAALVLADFEIHFVTYMADHKAAYRSEKADSGKELSHA